MASSVFSDSWFRVANMRVSLLPTVRVQRQNFRGRDWYVLTGWNLTPDGRCASCGTPCAGRFDGPPGHWGARRLPVRLRNFAPGAQPASPFSIL